MDFAALIRDEGFEGFKKVFDAGIDVNAKDHRGCAPLRAAAYWGEMEIARMLVDAGADVNTTDHYGDTPLHAAAVAGRTKMALFLIAAGARPIDSSSRFGSEVLEATMGLVGGIKDPDFGWYIKIITENPEALEKLKLDDEVIAKLLVASDGKLASYLNLQTT